MFRSLICGALLGIGWGWLAGPAQAALPANPRMLLVSARLNADGNCCTAAAPACCTPAPVCCKEPCITYRHRHACCKVCCGCTQPEPIKTTLQLKNPCTGCPVEIPLCIPGCTIGDPKVCSDVSCIGRDVVWYEWCNGFKAKVAFTHCGDVIVTTFGS